MINIECPYCGHRMSLKDAKPGVYQPKCGKCQAAFKLNVVKDGPGGGTTSKLDPAPKPASPAARPAAHPSPIGSPHVGTKATANLDETVPPSSVVRSRGAISPVSGTPGTDDLEQTSPSVGLRKSETRPTRADTGGKQVAQPPASGISTVPDIEKLGGYRVISELGRGGIGVVYLARQLSLDRNVALKVIQDRFAQFPIMISRFIREAYAAAQLNHHNVVQIYDLGNEGDTNFFSMEFVEGKDLGEVLKEGGKLDPEQAAGFILQAARGLQFAHAQGMVHRDIKPANLMLSSLGVIKVADLGLVKVADHESDEEFKSASVGNQSAQLTMAGSTIGTANYMAPEQAENAANVDHRADIYSLGCTFYTLLTGQPPFSGKTVVEVLSKHKNEPMAWPELQADRIPSDVSRIVLKMAAKKPEDRYPNLDSCIKDLESFLGVTSGTNFSPREQHVKLLEQSVGAYQRAPSVSIRKYVPLVFAGTSLIAMIVAVLFSFQWACFFGILLASSTVSYFSISGILGREHWMQQLRQCAVIAGWRIWFNGGLVAAVAGLLLFLLGWLPLAILGIVLGVGFAAALYFVIDKKIVGERQTSLDQAETLLKQLRLLGVDEPSLQRFVAKYGGNDWEEFFEALFGYQAKRHVRNELARSGNSSRLMRHRGWLDGIVDRMDKRLDKHRRMEDQEKLVKIEQKALQAQGVSFDEAKNQAERFASAMVQEAATWRNSARLPAASNVAADPVRAAELKRARIKMMLADARGGKVKRQSLLERLHPHLDLFLGAQIRLACGALMMLGCGYWLWQNGIFSAETAERIQSAASSAIDSQSVDAEQLVRAAGMSKLAVAEPLPFPIIGPWFSNLAVGVTGFLLLVSGLFSGWRFSLFLLPAAFIAMFGSTFGLPEITFLGIPDLSAMAIAGVLFVVGFMFRD